MATLTVAILTCNEEKNIPDAIASARQCGEQVLVVDSGSTDRTVELARALGADTAYRAWDEDFAAQRNFALTQAKGQWILYLDADERITPEAAAAINKIKKGPRDAQYSLKRINIAFGHEFHKGAFGPDRVTRLFPADQVHWVGRVHERPESALPKKDLPEALLHHTYTSFQQWWDKAGHYTTIWAEEAAARGRTCTAGTAAGHALAGMFKVYILQGGITEGAMGFIATLQHGIYTAMKYMKLLEQNRVTGKRP